MNALRTIAKTLTSAQGNVRVQNAFINFVKMSTGPKTYETLSVTVPQEYVYHVELNRPKKLNAMNNTMWKEIGDCFHDLDFDPQCRVIVLSGSGRIFCAGIDLVDAANMGMELAEHTDVVRRAKILKKYIAFYQDSMTSLEICRKPVLAAVHAGCIGAGLDMITSADVRYCTQDAYFQVKEVDVGMAADVGTLQRFPKVVGNDSVVRELCYTARKLPSDEAAKLGLVSQVFPDKETMIKEVVSVAGVIASKSPVAIQGIKENIVFSRDHTVQDGLDHINNRNQLALQSEDFQEATVAAATKNPDVKFEPL